jgi:hypothetical protein
MTIRENLFNEARELKKEYEKLPSIAQDEPITEISFILSRIDGDYKNSEEDLKRMIDVAKKVLLYRKEQLKNGNFKPLKSPNIGDVIQLRAKKNSKLKSKRKVCSCKKK